MSLLTTAVAASAALFAGMLVSVELGFRAGRRHTATVSDPHEGIGVIEAAIFALLGLLLGFSFGGATSRLDSRRELIVQETNAISAAYLWLDVLPASDQLDERRLFRDYIDARLHVYENVANLDAADRYIAQAAELQKQIWSRAVAASQHDATQNTVRLFLPAVSDMIDVTTARTVALRTRLPSLIFALLIIVALLSAFVAGYAMTERKRRSILHAVLFAAAVTATIYAVLDLDDPRFGLIRLDAAEQVMRALRDSIRV